MSGVLTGTYRPAVDRPGASNGLDPYAVTHPIAPYGRRGQHARGSAIDASMSILAAAPRDVISLAMGSPAPDAIPTAEIAAATADVLAAVDGGSALDYVPTEGHPALRRGLLERLEAQGLSANPACLLVTAGGMQGLDLACRLFLDPGDLVLAESPSYANGLATAHNNGGEIVQVPVDDEGLDLDAARAAVDEAGRAPRLVYAIPTFQNPSGVTYSLARREGLLELARGWGAIVVEDDPYSELDYGNWELPSLLRLDGGAGHVVQVRTFSKIVAPGLRLGWVVGPSDAVTRMIAAKQSMDTCANSLAQRVVARLLGDGTVDRHVERLRQLYPTRRDAMLTALHEHLGPLGASWTQPRGGMFVWVSLPSVDGEAVLANGLAAGVAVVPGSAFDAVRCRNAIRLCFSSVNEEAIAEGVRRLGSTIAGLLATDPTTAPAASVANA